MRGGSCHERCGLLAITPFVMIAVDIDAQQSKKAASWSPRARSRSSRALLS
jgi:hypothetical protein